MPVSKRREEYDLFPGAPRTRLAADAEPIEAAPSPALLLQEQLARGIAADPDNRKWSPRARVGLVVSASVALWAAIVMTTWRAINAVLTALANA
jgi:hypothetical protein